MASEWLLDCNSVNILCSSNEQESGAESTSPTCCCNQDGICWNTAHENSQTVAPRLHAKQACYQHALNLESTNITCKIVHANAGTKSSLCHLQLDFQMARNGWEGFAIGDLEVIHGAFRYHWKLNVSIYQILVKAEQKLKLVRSSNLLIRFHFLILFIFDYFLLFFTS